jgi:hypothetical protein
MSTNNISIKVESITNTQKSVPEELQCRYTSKRCYNERTTKRGGGLHTFCKYHRETANRRQRQLDTRKRQHKRAMMMEEQNRALEQYTSLLGLNLPAYEPLSIPTPTYEPYPSSVPLQFDDIKDVRVILIIWSERLDTT